MVEVERGWNTWQKMPEIPPKMDENSSERTYQKALQELLNRLAVRQQSPSLCRNTRKHLTSTKSSLAVRKHN